MGLFNFIIKLNMKVIVNSQGCISCGACVAICPNVFQFGEDGKSHVVKQPETEEEIKCAQEAAEACPVSVIQIEEGLEEMPKAA